MIKNLDIVITTARGTQYVVNKKTVEDGLNYYLTDIIGFEATNVNEKEWLKLSNFVKTFTDRVLLINSICKRPNNRITNVLVNNCVIYPLAAAVGGVIYTLSNDKTSFWAAPDESSMHALFSTIDIAAYYDNLPVAGVLSGAFTDFSNIKVAYIPSSDNFKYRYDQDDGDFSESTEVELKVHKGFVFENGSWLYYKDDGKLFTDGWVEAGGDDKTFYYYFVGGAPVLNTWKEYTNSGKLYWRYLGADGAAVSNCCVTDDSGSYYIGTDANMITRDWVKTESGSHSYVGTDGKVVTNMWRLFKATGKWVYLNEDGIITTNSWILDSTGLCFVGADGFMVTNKWLEKDGSWCHIDSTGHIEVNKWIEDSIGWCYVGANGLLVTEQWVLDNDGTSWCYLDKTGHMLTNDWAKDSIGWCFMDGKGYMMTNAWVSTVVPTEENPDHIEYYFIGSDGYMCKNRWVSGLEDADKGTITYSTASAPTSMKDMADDERRFYVGSDGKMLRGEHEFSGKRYTFADKDDAGNKIKDGQLTNIEDITTTSASGTVPN